MVCANPDLVVMHRGKPRALRRRARPSDTRRLGGAVRWHGKPYRSVYESCLALLGIADRAASSAIGDSLRTDIAGAAGAGIDSLFIAGGIHADEFGLAAGQEPDAARIDAALAQSRQCAALRSSPRFVW